MPKASEVLVEQEPKLLKPTHRLPVSAVVEVCMYKFTDQAGDVWEQYAGQDVALWQVQIKHAAQRSITFQIRDGFNDYLKAVHGSGNSMPTNLKDLEKHVGIRLVVSDTKDPEDVGFVQWRSAFYVAADNLKNFLLLLDGWFLFKARQMTQEQAFQVHLHPHVTVDIGDIWNELQYATRLVSYVFSISVCPL